MEGSVQRQIHSTPVQSVSDMGLDTLYGVPHSPGYIVWYVTLLQIHCMVSHTPLVFYRNLVE